MLKLLMSNVFWTLEEVKNVENDTLLGQFSSIQLSISCVSSLSTFRMQISRSAL